MIRDSLQRNQNRKSVAKCQYFDSDFSADKLMIASKVFGSTSKIAIYFTHLASSGKILIYIRCQVVAYNHLRQEQSVSAIKLSGGANVTICFCMFQAAQWRLRFISPGRHLRKAKVITSLLSF